MNDSLKQRSIIGVAWMLAQKIGAQVSTLLVFIVLARLLEPRDFGLMAMANVVVLFLSVIASQGLTSAIIQRQHLMPEHMSSGFWLNLFLGSVITGTCWLIAPWISALYGEPMVTTLIQALAINALLEAMVSVQNSILQRAMAFKSIAVRKLSAELVAGSVGIAAALLGFGVWSLVIRAITSLLVQTLLFWWLTPWRPQRRFSPSHARDLVGYGIHVMGVNVLNFGSRQADDLLVGAFLGATALGQYTVAKRLLLTAVDVLRGGVGSVAWTLFSRLQQDVGALRASFIGFARWVCVIGSLLFLLLAVLPQHYVPIIFGDQWLPAAPLIHFLAIACGIEAIRSTHESLILAVGHAKVRLRLAAILLIANWSAFFLLQQKGLLAVSMAYAVIAAVLLPLWIAPVLRFTQTSLWHYLSIWKETAPALAAAILIYAGWQRWIGADWFSQDSLNQGWFNLGIGGMLLAVSYGAIALAVNPRLIREARNWRQ